MNSDENIAVSTRFSSLELMIPLTRKMEVSSRKEELDREYYIRLEDLCDSGHVRPVEWTVLLSNGPPGLCVSHQRP